jgi:iron complex transport system ATP-binding protein
MQAGKVVAQGTPEDVFQPQLVRDVFSIDVAIVRHPQTGTPAMLVTP